MTEYRFLFCRKQISDSICAKRVKQFKFMVIICDSSKWAVQFSKIDNKKFSQMKKTKKTKQFHYTFPSSTQNEDYSYYSIGNNTTS
jgi:hypothetical protein